MVVPGFYRHYKGGAYEVTGFARMEADGTEAVIYRPMYDSPDMPPDTVWVRPLSEFEELVDVEGVKVPRYQWADVLEETQ